MHKSTNPKYQAILEAAKQAFIANGYSGASIGAIALVGLGGGGGLQLARLWRSKQKDGA